MNTDRFAKKLRSLRQEKNLTQKELARRLFVSHKTVSKWETGRGLPDTVLFPALAEILGTSTDELFGAVPSDYYSELRRNTDEESLYAGAYRTQRFRTFALGMLSALLAVATVVFAGLFVYFRGAYTDTLLRQEYTLLYKDYSDAESEWTKKIYTQEEFRTQKTALSVEAGKGAAVLVSLKKTEYDRAGNKREETFFRARTHELLYPAEEGGWQSYDLAEGLPAEYLLESIPELDKEIFRRGGGSVTYCVRPGTHYLEFCTENGSYFASLRVYIPEDGRERAELCFEAEEGGSISAFSPDSRTTQSRFPYPVVEGKGFGSLTLRDEGGREIAVFGEIDDLVTQNLSCGGRIVVIYEQYPDEWRRFFSPNKGSVCTVRIQLIGSEKYRDVSMTFDFYLLKS